MVSCCLRLTSREASLEKANAFSIGWRDDDLISAGGFRRLDMAMDVDGEMLAPARAAADRDGSAERAAAGLHENSMVVPLPWQSSVDAFPR